MLAFPRDILTPATERWRLTGVAINGGVPTAGAPGQARTDGGGFWMCWQTDIALETTEELKTGRAVEAYLDGGAQPMIVSCFESATRPAFSTPTDILNCGVSAPAALRSTTIQTTMTGPQRFTGGERFSITHPTKGKRLYSVVYGSVVGTGPVQTIGIRPPLREAVTAIGIDLNDPGCVMRLANPDDFLGALDATHSSTANPVWIEDLRDVA